MAGISIVEDRNLLPEHSGVNPIVLVQNFFQSQGYTRLNVDSTRLDVDSPRSNLFYYQMYRFAKRIICDIFILHHCRDTEAAEPLVTNLDSEYVRLKRLILQGKFDFPTLTIKNHHFLTVHKKMRRHSYMLDNLPVGFLIRPLITVDEADQWDYFAGSNRRIDVVSSDFQSLTSYLDRHRQDDRPGGQEHSRIAITAQ